MKSSPETRVPTRTVDDNLVILDQQLALGAYLNALLTPPPGVETAPEPQPEVHAEPVSAPQAVSPPAATLQPDWAAGEFQCLLFQVAGLTLAVPLARLNGVIPWDDSGLTEMPNHSPWFLGLREHQGRRARMVDLAAVVLPPARYRELAPPDSGRLGKVVMIDDHRWGLACDEVGEVITLNRDDVKWRTDQARRPWLAGTVIEQMCALLDTDALARMLGEEGPEAG